MKAKGFEQLSMFNKFMITYRKTQKVKKKNDLIEMKNSIKNGDDK